MDVEESIQIWTPFEKHHTGCEPRGLPPCDLPIQPETVEAQQVFPGRLGGNNASAVGNRSSSPLPASVFPVGTPMRKFPLPR